MHIDEGDTEDWDEPIEMREAGGRVRYLRGSEQQVGDRHLYGVTEATFDGDGETPTMTMRIEVRNEMVQVRRITIDAEDEDHGIRPKDIAILRANFAPIIEIALGQRQFRRDADTGELIPFHLVDEDDVKTYEDVVRGARTRTRLTDAKLQKVADVYRANVDTGAPALAIRQSIVFGGSVTQPLPRETVNYWLRQCRERGFLPPTTQGKVEA